MSKRTPAMQALGTGVVLHDKIERVKPKAPPKQFTPPPVSLGEWVLFHPDSDPDSSGTAAVVVAIEGKCLSVISATKDGMRLHNSVVNAADPVARDENRRRMKKGCWSKRADPEITELRRLVNQLIDVNRVLQEKVAAILDEESPADFLAPDAHDDGGEPVSLDVGGEDDRIEETDEDDPS